MVRQRGALRNQLVALSLTGCGSSRSMTSTATTPPSPPCSAIRLRRGPGGRGAGGAGGRGEAVPGPFAAAVLAARRELAVPVHRIRGNGEREVAEAVGAPPPA